MMNRLKSILYGEDQDLVDWFIEKSNIDEHSLNENFDEYVVELLSQFYCIRYMQTGLFSGLKGADPSIEDVQNAAVIMINCDELLRDSFEQEYGASGSLFFDLRIQKSVALECILNLDEDLMKNAKYIENILLKYVGMFMGVIDYLSTEGDLEFLSVDDPFDSYMKMRLAILKKSGLDDLSMYKCASYEAMSGLVLMGDADRKDIVYKLLQNEKGSGVCI